MRQAPNKQKKRKETKRDKTQFAGLSSDLDLAIVATFWLFSWPFFCLDFWQCLPIVAHTNWG